MVTLCVATFWWSLFNRNKQCSRTLCVDVKAVIVSQRRSRDSLRTRRAALVTCKRKKHRRHKLKGPERDSHGTKGSTKQNKTRHGKNLRRGQQTHDRCRRYKTNTTRGCSHLLTASQNLLAWHTTLLQITSFIPRQVQSHTSSDRLRWTPFISLSRWIHSRLGRTFRDEACNLCFSRIAAAVMHMRPVHINI